MTIYTGWRVLVGKMPYVDGSPFAGVNTTRKTNFTSRTLEIQVDMSCDFGKVGQSNATVKLDNSDGAFTPFGGGTYDDLDWVSNFIIIQGQAGTSTLTYTSPLFYGFVSDVKYEDDGFTSTVTLECEDGWTFAYRTVTKLDYDNFLSPQNMKEVAEDLWSAAYSYYPPSFVEVPPGIGYNSVARVETLDESFLQPLELSVDTGTNVGDVINDLIASEHGILLPCLIVDEEQAGPGYNYNEFRTYLIARDHLFPFTGDPDTYEFKFVETSPTGTELPFKNPTVGFNIDQLNNSAFCTIAGAGAVTQEAKSQASIDQYGTRSSEFSSLTFGYDADALELAQFLSTRFDSVTFGVTGLTITGNMIRGKCADAALDVVKDLIRAPYSGTTYPTFITGCIYKPAHIEFTGAGGVDLTSTVAFFRASWKITTEDWELTLSDGRPAEQVFGFKLNATRYGVLGTNRVA